MSVEQNVRAYYGWVIDTSPEVMSWFESIDYESPKGFRLLGMDSDTIAVGLELFDSGSNRWGPMDGDSLEIDAKDALFWLEEWQKEHAKILSELFNEDFGDIPPKFHVFIDHS